MVANGSLWTFEEMFGYILVAKLWLNDSRNGLMD